MDQKALLTGSGSRRAKRSDPIFLIPEHIPLGGSWEGQRKSLHQPEMFAFRLVHSGSRQSCESVLSVGPMPISQSFWVKHMTYAQKDRLRAFFSDSLSH